MKLLPNSFATLTKSQLVRLISTLYLLLLTWSYQSFSIVYIHTSGVGEAVVTHGVGSKLSYSRKQKAESRKQKAESCNHPLTPPSKWKLKSSELRYKSEASQARFEADELPDYGPFDDSMTLKLLVRSSGSVRIRGRCLGPWGYGINHFQMERGAKDKFGANNDNGKKMLKLRQRGIK